jgi:hypothetical protein
VRRPRWSTTSVVLRLVVIAAVVAAIAHVVHIV